MVPYEVGKTFIIRIHGFHGKIKFFKNINFFPKG